MAFEKALGLLKSIVCFGATAQFGEEQAGIANGRVVVGGFAADFLQQSHRFFAPA